jgi:hypothetical protein
LSTKKLHEDYDRDLEQITLTVKDPRFWLKCMIVVLTLILVAYAIFLYQAASEKGEIAEKYQSWAAIIGVYLAAVGWLTSAIVTVRNSVKQHTITTLLQTRLSTTYMDKAMKALDFYLQSAYSSFNPAPAAVVKASASKNDIEYVLNYFEFLAVGIREGDLHENVLRLSMRGIVVRFTRTSSDYIQALRQDNGPLTFANLLWLYSRWYDARHDRFPMW